MYMYLPNKYLSCSKILTLLRIITIMPTIFPQLTTETYVESVAMFSQIIELTEDNVNDQTDIALGKTASLFKDLAEFVNAFDVIINTTVSAKLMTIYY